MAIQMRRGAYDDFDPTKMVAGEIAVVMSGDTGTQDGKAVYVCMTAGTVARLATWSEVLAYVQGYQIGTAQIADLAITSAKLAVGSVITAKIDTGAVTADKLDANAVPVVTGATSGAAGAKGLVPAPDAGGTLDTLFGNGLWSKLDLGLSYASNRVSLSLSKYKDGQGTFQIDSVTLPDATTSNSGTMSAADKAKLDSIDADPTVTYTVADGDLTISLT